MKLVDTNVLLHAVNPSAAEHDRCRRWVEGALSGGAPVGFAWLALVGFVRIATHPGILPRPLTSGDAMDLVDAWLATPSARLLQPGARHPGLLREMLDAVGAAGNLTNDAHLAALAVEHRATMVSLDSDFARFPGVRWERPAFG